MGFYEARSCRDWGADSGFTAGGEPTHRSVFDAQNRGMVNSGHSQAVGTKTPCFAQERSAVWKDDGAVHGQVIGGSNGQCTSGFFLRLLSENWWLEWFKLVF